MKKNLYLLSILMFISCVESKVDNEIVSSEVKEEKSTTTKNDEPEEEQIKVDVAFKPTMVLTDEIKNTTLKDLILKEKGKFSSEEQKDNNRIYQEALIKAQKNPEMKKILKDLSPNKYTEMTIIRRFAPKKPMSQRWYETKGREHERCESVPESSNLAKVYYLQDMGEFVRHNEDYFEKIEGERLRNRPTPPTKVGWEKYQ